MSMENVTNSVKTYRAEVDKLGQAYPGKYSPLKLLLLFPAWYKYLNNKSSPVQDELPWLTFAAINFLKKTLTTDMVVYEFGSGGSSLFLAKKVKLVYSVEHDETWFVSVSHAIRNKGYTNWSGRVILPVYCPGDGEKSPSDPDAYVSGSPYYVGFSFESYAKSIDSFSDSYFDLVLIDGRARPSCFKHAIPKVKVGGYIMWDNTDRPYYLENINKYDENLLRTDFPGPSPYVNFFTQTSIWLKQK
jgi:hypothetical protein